MLRQRIPTPSNCGNGCAVVVPETGNAQVFVRSDDAFTYWYPVATNWGWHFFTSHSSSTGSYALMAAPTDGTPAVTVQTFPAMSNLQIYGTADIGGALVYSVSQQQTLNSPWRHTLHTWSIQGGTPTQLAVLPTRPMRGAMGTVSFAGMHVLALEDGIYAVNMYQPDDVQQLYAGSNVTALHVEDTGRFYFATQGNPSVIHAYSLFADEDRPVVHLGNVTDLVELGVDSSLAVLNDQGVWLVDLDSERPNPPQLVYATRDFPQGFPWLQGLEANDDGAIYVGQVCHQDADAPGYGTVKLELPTGPNVTPQRMGGASWVTGTPQWPWNTPVLDSSWSDLGRTQGNAFVIRHVGD